MIRPTFTAALLAGGHSTRFGSEKALADFEDQPLWRTQWRKLESLSPDRLLLSLQNPRPWVPVEIEVCYDKTTGAGPLAAIAQLLAQIETSHLVVLAVDLPLMTPDFLQKLQSLIRSERGMVPRRAPFYEGLCAIYPKAGASLAAECLRGPNLSIAHFIDRCLAADLLVIFEVAESDHPLFTNWNVSHSANDGAMKPIMLKD